MIFGSDGVRHFNGTHFDPKNQLSTVKHIGGNLIVWGCFSCPIYKIEGIMGLVT